MAVAVAGGQKDDVDDVVVVMKLTTTGGFKVVILAFGSRGNVLDNKEVDAIMGSLK